MKAESADTQATRACQGNQLLGIADLAGFQDLAGKKANQELVDSRVLAGNLFQESAVSQVFLATQEAEYQDTVASAGNLFLVSLGIQVTLVAVSLAILGSLVQGCQVTRALVVQESAGILAILVAESAGILALVVNQLLVLAGFQATVDSQEVVSLVGQVYRAIQEAVSLGIAVLAGFQELELLGIAVYRAIVGSQARQGLAAQ